MRDDVEYHEIWLSIGNAHRGKSKAQKTSLKALDRMFAQYVADNSITYAEYMKLGESKEGKAIQGEKKMAAGFIVAGKFKNGSRKIGDMVGRSGIQIDIDYATPEQAAFILDGLAEINEWAYLWHTTRAHCQKHPRIRIIVPLTRLVNGDEANAITRYLALTLADNPEEAIEIPDLVSFRPNQIMYLPTISRGQEYLHGFHGDAPVLNPDDFLAAHPDWQDYTKLPRQADEKSAENTTGKSSMEDPTEKPGVIGAFCRAYGAEEAIAEFLDDIYVPGASSGTDIRYSYALGSAYNGVVVYDDMFVHSHHGTDPADGQHNVFDLVRIHKFGHLDEAANGNTSPGNMPSFKAMTEWALKDERVKKERATALAFDDDEFDDLEDEDATDIDDLLGIDDEEEDENSDFDDLPDEDDEDDEAAEKPKKKAKDKKPKGDDDDSPWQERLVLDKADQVEKSRFNAGLIISNDRRIAPTIAYNELAGAPYVRSILRFSKVPECVQAPVKDKIVGRPWTDADTAALNIALSAPTRDKGYGRDFATQDLETAMILAAQKNSFNPFLDMVNRVEWDGVKRLGTNWIEFLGAPDTAYVRELEVLFFVATIARQYEPGHPFHLVPIFGGKQGGGKTGYIKAIAFESRFYGELSGDFSNLQKMVETTLGKVITEMPELKGTHRSLIQDIKQYFTSEKDTIRLAYRRNAEDFYRRNTTIGTTNEDEFLRDDENRRFCPVPVAVDQNNVVDFNRLIPLIPQLWAEAVQLYLAMRKAQPKRQLDLGFKSPEAKAEAIQRQAAARETLIHEPVAEVIDSWLNKPLSASAVAAGDEAVDEFDGDEGDEMFVRNYVTATMIREQLSQSPVIRDLKMNPDKVIGMAMRSLENWESLGKCRRCGEQRRWFVRAGLDINEEYVPLSSIRGQGAAPREPEIDEDDLLG